MAAASSMIPRCRCRRRCRRKSRVSDISLFCAELALRRKGMMCRCLRHPNLRSLKGRYLLRDYKRNDVVAIVADTQVQPRQDGRIGIARFSKLVREIHQGF